MDGGGQGVFEAGLGLVLVAGAGDVGGLAHGALDAGADPVAGGPFLGGLFCPGGLDGLVDTVLDPVKSQGPY